MTATVIFVDSTRWDGRHYSLVSPTYLNFTQAAHLLDLPLQGAFDIYAGDNAEPLDDRASLHIAPGTTLTVAPSDALPCLHVQLTHMLQRASFFAQEFAFPPDDRIAYYVVAADAHMLCE